MRYTGRQRMKLLLVDDQLLFLESLKMVIENLSDDMSVVGLAQNGKEAIEAVERLSPEIILMDVRMPEMDGVTATRIIKEKHKDIRIIMLTTFEHDDYVNEALHNGAEGYMLKNIPPEMLIASIRAVFNGAVLISPDVAGQLIETLYRDSRTASDRLNRDLPDWYYHLNSREKSILKLMIDGKTNKEIAAEIHIGFQTIRNYISRIYTKLEVSNRTEALRKVRTIDKFLFF